MAEKTAGNSVTAELSDMAARAFRLEQFEDYLVFDSWRRMLVGSRSRSFR